MKILCASLVLLLQQGGADAAVDGGDGIALYAAGKYAEAVGAFRAALDTNPDDARLNFNLALSLWRTGDEDAAETAAEKAAALGSTTFDGLRDGILGNLRYDKARTVAAAKVDPQKEFDNLGRALYFAKMARQHFQRGALKLEKRKPGSGAELLRNLERSIRLEEELTKRREEAKKNQKPSDKKKKDGGKDSENVNDEQKGDDESKDDKADKGDKEQQQDPKEKQDKPEPDTKKTEDEKKALDPDEDEKNKPHQAQEPQQAPGEHDPTKELSPEQKRQLMKLLSEAEANLKKLKAARKAARPKVKKDW